MDFALLIALCVLGALLGRWQNAARNDGRSDPITLVARTTVGAPAQALNGALNSGGEFFAGWLRSGEIAAENRRLAQLARVADLYADREADLQREIAALRKQLALPSFDGHGITRGVIIGLFPYENRLTLRLNSGNGIKPGMPVVAADGMVGVVQTVDGDTCQALLLSAPSVRVGALVLGDPPQAGLLRGETPDLWMVELLAGDAEIRPGAWVVTSGYSDRVPRGIPIGRVARVDSQPEYGQRRVRVAPSVRLGEVREVVVIR